MRPPDANGRRIRRPPAAPGTSPRTSGSGAAFDHDQPRRSSARGRRDLRILPHHRPNLADERAFDITERVVDIAAVTHLAAPLARWSLTRSVRDKTHVVLAEDRHLLDAGLRVSVFDRRSYKPLELKYCLGGGDSREL